MRASAAGRSCLGLCARARAVLACSVLVVPLLDSIVLRPAVCRRMRAWHCKRTVCGSACSAFLSTSVVQPLFVVILSTSLANTGFDTSSSQNYYRYRDMISDHYRYPGTRRGGLYTSPIITLTLWSRRTTQKKQKQKWGRGRIARGVAAGTRRSHALEHLSIISIDIAISIAMHSPLYDS